MSLIRTNFSRKLYKMWRTVGTWGTTWNEHLLASLFQGHWSQGRGNRPPHPPAGGAQPCLGAPPQFQYFYCFIFLILKIVIYISMIKCHGQLAGTGGGGINSTILAALCCTKAFSNLQAWKRK